MKWIAAGFAVVALASCGGEDFDVRSKGQGKIGSVELAPNGARITLSSGRNYGTENGERYNETPVSLRCKDSSGEPVVSTEVAAYNDKGVAQWEVKADEGDGPVPASRATECLVTTASGRVSLRVAMSQAG